jgi:hypothetical protein
LIDDIDEIDEPDDAAEGHVTGDADAVYRFSIDSTGSASQRPTGVNDQGPTIGRAPRSVFDRFAITTPTQISSAPAASTAAVHAIASQGARTACTAPARRLARNERNKLRRRVEHEPMICIRCGESFVPKGADAVTCSNRCRQAMHRKRNA